MHAASQPLNALIPILTVNPHSQRLRRPEALQCPFRNWMEGHAFAKATAGRATAHPGGQASATCTVPIDSGNWYNSERSRNGRQSYDLADAIQLLIKGWRVHACPRLSRQNGTSGQPSAEASTSSGNRRSQFINFFSSTRSAAAAKLSHFR